MKYKIEDKVTDEFWHTVTEMNTTMLLSMALNTDKFKYLMCNDCGKPEQDMDTIANEWLHVIDYNGYLCRRCSQLPMYDDIRKAGL